MKRINHNQGYIGLIMLMVTIAIIAFLMVSQYQTLGIAPVQNKSSDTSVSTTGSDPNSISPIDRAKNANSLLENLDRANLKQ
jgi:hypothetical protein